MVCPQGQGGIEPVRTFNRQGGGSQFFVVLCGPHAFYDAAPYYVNAQKDMKNVANYS